MNEIAKLFNEIGEPFAAGFFEEPSGSPARRFCRAFRRYYENCPMTYEAESVLFPSGKIQNGNMAVFPSLSYLYEADMNKLTEKSADAARIFERFAEAHNTVSGYVHCVLNYRRVLAEGIDGYERRIRALSEGDFRDAMLDLLTGLRAYHARAIKYLKESNAPCNLITALEKVPFQPAETVYEALTALNFVLYLDYCDNAGRLDSYLTPFWRGENIDSHLRRLMQNIQDNGKWSITLGPDYSELTRQILCASAGLSRPLLQLRVSDNMPKDLWDLALGRALSGGGQPAFYNDIVIQRRLKNRLPDAPESDLIEFVGCGCTETGFAGMTYSGGTDTNLNVLKVFEEHLKAELSVHTSFNDFYGAFCKRVFAAQDALVEYVNAYYDKRAETVFDPIRTLFVDDCIEKQKGFYQGGARYTFAIPPDSGIPNTIDSLLAVKSLVYERKIYSPRDFLDKLEAQDGGFLGMLEKCPSYGVGNDEADDLAFDLTSKFYARYKQAKLNIGLGFFPTSHQFDRHIECGKEVGATPDGRRNGMPVADSIAAVNGKAVKGPTVMLRSASKFSQEDIYGIAVLNLSVTKRCPSPILRALIEGYFSMGGTQIQITAVDRDTLLDAKAHPEKHRDLIVRVGGYSGYFGRLTPELQDAVIARTVFERGWNKGK